MKNKSIVLLVELGFVAVMFIIGWYLGIGNYFMKSLTFLFVIGAKLIETREDSPFRWILWGLISITSGVIFSTGLLAMGAVSFVYSMIFIVAGGILILKD